MRIDEERRLRRDLFEGGCLRGEHGHTTSHRLEHGKAEPLVQRGINEQLGMGVERGKRVLVNVAEVFDGALDPEGFEALQ